MKKILLTILIIILLIPTIYVARILIGFPFTPEQLIVNQPAERVDLIVVPSGEMERLKYAFYLAEHGYADKILYSGGYVDNYQNDYMNRMRVKGVELVVLSDSISTYTDAILTKKYIQNRNIHKLMLVTSPYHSYRAYKTFTKIIPDKKIISVPVVGSAFKISDAKYKENSFSQQSFKSEQLKYLFYAVKYGI